MFAAAIVAQALAALAPAQDSVVLREWAELPEHGPVTLGQVAELEGEQAAGLGGTVIPLHGAGAVSDGWATIELSTVRDAIRAVPGINWGRLVLRGSSCAVRRGGASHVSVRAPDPGTRAPGPGVPAVRDLVTQRLHETLGGDRSEIRLTFDDSDRVLLDTPVAGCTADVQMIGTSDRQAVTVRLYEGLRQVAAGTVRVGVSVKRTVTVCTTPLRRGDPILAGQVSVEERWISPTIRPVEAGGAVGRVARGTIRAGSVIEESDAESPVLIKKGDLVDVYCLSSSINLKSIARALESGREGEVIKFQTPSGSRPFLARVDGPSRAVTGVGALSGAADQPASIGDAAAPARAAHAAPPAPATDSRSRRVKFIDLGNKSLNRPAPDRREDSR